MMKKFVGQDWRGEQVEFSSDREHVRYSYSVAAGNGEFVIGKGYWDIKSAKSALSYMLKKYDRQEIGACGNWFKVSEVI